MDGEACGVSVDMKIWTSIMFVASFIIKTVQKIYTCCSSLSADLIEFFYLFEVFHWLPGADLCRMQHTQLQ